MCCQGNRPVALTAAHPSPSTLFKHENISNNQHYRDIVYPVWSGACPYEHHDAHYDEHVSRCINAAFRGCGTSTDVDGHMELRWLGCKCVLSAGRHIFPSEKILFIAIDVRGAGTQPGFQFCSDSAVGYAARWGVPLEIN
jgi:hypothetical protein